MVGRHLRALEQWLGIELFIRGNGRLSLTPAGEAYHARISAALGEIVVATADAMGTAGGNSLRIWCIPGFAAQWLGEQIVAFESRWPQHRIELRPTDVPADLMAYDADVDIRYHGDQWPPRPGGRLLRHIELARPPVTPVASPALLERLGRIDSVERLLSAPLLHEEHEEQWLAWFRMNGVTATQLGGPLLWHAHMAIAAARMDRGIALANSFLVAKDLAQGSLIELDIPGGRPAVLGAYCFTCREDRWSAPAVVRLRHFLLARAQAVSPA